MRGLNVPTNPACAIVLIHGLGDQPRSWSQTFRRALRDELAADAARVEMIDAYWAPVSTLADTLRPGRAAAPFGAAGMSVEDETYRRTSLEFSRMLAAEAGAPARAHSFGPLDFAGAITGRLPGGRELVVDVSNYVARNGVRTAVQHALHDKLVEAHARLPGVPVILASHSQGTIISYDVLRQAGGSYPQLRTWITMGSPLLKYFGFPLHWGRQQLGVPPNLRWLNLYDQGDIVGKNLAGAVDWPSPQPEDRVVDNSGNAGDAHDHWNNPEVVRAIADEIRRELAAAGPAAAASPRPQRSRGRRAVR